MLLLVPHRSNGARKVKTHCIMAAFFCTQWLRAHRLQSVGSLHILEIIQEPLRDYAKVAVVGHKSNKKGARISEVEADSSAMYSNTRQPEFNWFFQMGLLHFAFPPEPGGNNIWGLDGAGKAMGDALADFIDGLAEDEEFLRLLGCTDVSQLRSHSIRKGILTWLIGQSEGVDFYSMFKRAGYKISEKIREYLYARGGKDGSLAR